MIPAIYPLIGFLVCAAVLAGLVIVPFLSDILSRLCAGGTRSVASEILAAICVIGFAYYGATKGHISYPRTDPEIAYLIDRGSYVTNDAIHVDFQRLVAPSDATMYIDYRPEGSTNDLEWVNFWTGTFASFTPPPIDIPFPAATGYNWVVYTDWTPGPSVRTNGVWHLIWQTDTNAHRHIIPIRTGIYDNGERLSPTRIVIPANLSNPNQNTEDN